MKPTRTTNRLHFSDLDPLRFEDLCLNLVFRHREWQDIRHYGRKGSDGGIDIYATENLDGQNFQWNIQCRRYSSATKAMLTKTVDDIVDGGNQLPHTLLVTLACDVSRHTQEEFFAYAKSKGIVRPLLWTASVLEAQLYSERPDILFTYFGVSKQGTRNNRKKEIENKVRLRKKLWDTLVRRDFDPRASMKCPATKFKSGLVLIRNIDDLTYPSFDNEGEGISPWFKLELYDFYSDGIECYLNLESGLLDKDGQWAVGDDVWMLHSNETKKIGIYTIGCIPYSNIVTVDYDGDGNYPFPHLFCLFDANNGPYERMKYVYSGSDFDWELDTDKRVVKETVPE